MPIPQLERKKEHHAPHYVRDASSVRKKRAAIRRGEKAGSLHRRIKDVPSRDAGHKNWTSRITKKRILQILAVGIALGGVGSILTLGVAYAWVSKDLASIEDVEKRAVDQSTKIYARDGETLLYEIGDNKRTDVSFDQISDDVKAATIALEDQHFYQHSGFKVTSIVRAALFNTFSTSRQGASTLTQQFVKNAILTSERTYTRKLKELILAIRLERKYSKDEILALYLNEVYYGPNYQGVETASQEYFNKSSRDVSLAEAATIAALPKDPVDLPHDPKRLKARRDYALDRMVDITAITQEEADEAKAADLNVNTEVITGIKAPHFVFFVRSYLEKKYGQNKINKGGLKVITTLDWEKQQKAEKAIADGMPKVERLGGSNAGLVSLDAHTGQILAMVGSQNFFDEEHDGQFNVSTSPLQPGSSFKPIVYVTAFMKGYTPATMLYDIETDFPTEVEGKYHPRNFDLSEHGPVTLRTALAHSYNIPAVKLIYLVSVNETLNTAESLGYTSLRDRSQYGLSLALGSGAVSLLEHTAAFATFAREGEHHPVASVLRVEEKNGTILEEWHDNPRIALNKEPVRVLNDVLSDSAARAPTFSLLTLPDRPVGAKTGTTNSFRDAWAMGYTPSLATGVWVGNNDNAAMQRGADGIDIAAPVWRQYMQSVLTGTVVEHFKKPSALPATEVPGGKIYETKKIKVDLVTGQRIPDECLSTYPPQYIGEKEYKETHTILHYLTRSDPKGPAPTNPRDDPMYTPWETAVVAWTKKEEQQDEYLSDVLPTANCALRDKEMQPRVAILLPEDGEEVGRRDFTIEIVATPGKGRTITKVKYLIDVITVEEVADLSLTKERALRSSYKPKTLTLGHHTVKVRIEDDFGNFAEHSVGFDYVE